MPRGAARSGEHLRTVESLTKGGGARAEGRTQEAPDARAGAEQQPDQGMQADWPELPAQQKSGTRRARRPPPQQPGAAAQPATPPPSPVKVAPQRLAGTRYTDDDGAAERITRMRADFQNFSWQLLGEAADSEGADGADTAVHAGSARASVGRGRDEAGDSGPLKRQPDTAVPSPPRPKASRQGGSPYRGQPKRQPASAVSQRRTLTHHRGPAPSHWDPSARTRAGL
jgi:hypothetical protein